MIATVEYHIATYRGKVTVFCQPDDDNETIIAKAKAKLRQRVYNFPLGYEGWKVIKRS